MTPSEARDAARRAFGGVDQVRFDHREQRGLPALDSVMQDVLFAVRLLVKDRWNSLDGALALALGIAVSTTVFTLINGITLQELPVDDPDRVVHLVTNSPRGRADTAYPDLADWQLSVVQVAGQAVTVPAIEAPLGSAVRLRIRARDVALQRAVLPSSAKSSPWATS